MKKQQTIKILLFQILAIILFSLKLIKTQQSQNNNLKYTYSSYPIKEISQSDYCEGQSFLEQILDLKNVENAFIGWGTSCALILFKLVGDQNDDYSIQEIKVLQTSTGDYQYITQPKGTLQLWIIKSQSILIFDISDPFKQFNLIKQIPNKATSLCLDSVFLQEKNIIVTIHERQLLYYDMTLLILISDSFKISDVDSPILAAAIFRNKFALIYIYYDINFYQYEKLSSSAVQTTNKMCSTFSQYNQKMNKMVNIKDRYIALLTASNSLYFADLDKFFQTGDCQDIIFNGILKKQKYVLQKFIQTSLNNQFLIVYEVFNSIKIFELSYDNNQFNQKLFYRIVLEDKVYDVKFIKNETFISVLTRNKIIFYKKLVSNYQIKYPNILSINDNIYFNNYPQKNEYSWRCLLDNDLFYFSKGTDGIIVFKKDALNNQLNFVNSLIVDAGLYDNVYPIKGTSYVLLDKEFLYFVDGKDLTKPTVLSIQNFGFDNIDADDLKLSKDGKIAYIAAGYPGFLIVDISDFNNPKLISHSNHNYMKQTSSENLIISQNEKYAFLAYRYLGIVVFDIRDITNPKVVSYFGLEVAEDFRISKDETFMVISDYETGIVIVDITDLSNMKEISRVYVEGSTLRVVLTHNDQFVLSVSEFKGQLQLIDIRNLKNPVVIQKYQYNFQDYAYDVCQTPDEKFAYLAGLDGIVFLNIETEKNFNIDILVVENGAPVRMIALDKVLEVGQTIMIKLAEIYPEIERKFSIFNAYYYINFEIQQLPSWSDFSFNRQSLTIDLKKEALSLNKEEGQIEIKQFLFEIKEILFQNDFIYESIGIREKESFEIYTECKIKEITNSVNYVTKFSQEFINLTLKDRYTAEQINHILYVLKMKTITFPIFVKIQSSLRFDKDSSTITSRSDSLSLLVQSNLKDGQFVKMYYPGVLVYYNDNQNEIKIEGSIHSVNNVIKNSFKFANLTKPESINLTIVIDDKINYPISIQFPASDEKLIKLNKQTMVNSEFRIQEDFSNKFQDSSIYILQSFLYTFSTNTFIDLDDSVLEYSAKIKIDGQFVNIPQGYWIDFSAQDRTFFGMTQVSQFRDVVEIMVNATDGYTHTSDILKIKIDKIPLIYIIQICVQVLSPVIGIFGMWRYKSLVINCLRKKKILSTPMKIQIGEKFYFQIPLLENHLKNAQIIWDQFSKQISKDVIRIELKQVKLLLSQIGSDLQLKGSSSCKNQIIINLNTDDDNLEQINSLENKRHTNSSIIYQGAINSSRDYIAREVQATFSRAAKKLQKSRMILEKRRKTYQLGNESAEKLQFFTTLGYINRSSILNQIIQWDKSNKNKKKLSPEIVESLKKSKSKLSIALIGLAARFFVQIDQLAFDFISLLKEIALSDGFLENDWYKAYVSIIPQIDHFFNEPFPKIKFNKQKIEDQIKELEIREQKNKEEMDILMPLINEYLYAEVLGLSFQKKTPIISANRGECIEAFQHEIYCIKAFRSINNSKETYNTKKQKETLSYQQKELYLNTLIPSWVQSVDISNGSILLIGNPSSKDLGHYLFKIINTSNIFLKAFEIEIINKKKKLDDMQNESDCIIENYDVPPEPTEEEVHYTAYSNQRKNLFKLSSL